LTHSNPPHTPPPPQYLLLTLSSGCEPKNRLYYLALDGLPRGEDGVLDLAVFDRRKGADATPLPIVKLVDDFEASWDYVANVGSVFTFQTNYQAPRNRCGGGGLGENAPQAGAGKGVCGEVSARSKNVRAATATASRALASSHSHVLSASPLAAPLSLSFLPPFSLLRTDIATPSPPSSWEVVIPEHPEDLLQWASALAGDALVVCWLRNVCSVLELRSLESGSLVRNIPLPGLGSVASFSGAWTGEREMEK